MHEMSRLRWWAGLGVLAAAVASIPAGCGKRGAPDEAAQPTPSVSPEHPPEPAAAPAAVETVSPREEVERLWREARADAKAVRLADAKDKLLRVMQLYERAGEVSFDLAAAQMLLGEVCFSLKDLRMARQMLESAARSPAWEKAARARLAEWPEYPRFRPMHERFNGQKLALLCARRGPDGIVPFPDLALVFRQDCSGAQMDCEDISLDLQPAALEEFFDGQHAEALRLVGGRRAGVLLAVLVEGETEGSESAGRPAKTGIKFHVFSVTRGTLAFSGQFREALDSEPAAYLAEQAAALLIERHLVPACPSIP